MLDKLGMTDFAALGNATYVSIESYRRDGAAVRTPVWIVADGEFLYCWTLGKSGKVKRTRAESRVKLAKCNAAGNIRGEWVDAIARVLDSPDEVERQARRMRRKYGLKFTFFRLLPRLRGTRPVVIEFRSTPASSASTAM